MTAAQLPSAITPALSVIVPCFNEEAVLAICYRRLSDALGADALSYEIIFVDDGSRDGTLPMLQALHEQDARVTVVELSRNFGHQVAVSAGLEAARGEAVAIIDADLQDPPELIPRMVELWRGGAQVVYGVRQDRAGETGFKIWTAKAFYRIINRLSDVEIPLDTGDFRLMDRKVVEVLLQMPERQRLLRAMCSWTGFRQVGLPYRRAPRLAGETKYPLSKMLNLALDGIVSFSTVPLRLLTFLGFGAALLALLGIVYALLVRVLTQHWVQGWATLFIGVLFLSGIQLISLGIMGEYLGRIYTEVKRRPLYVVARVRRAGVSAGV